MRPTAISLCFIITLTLLATGFTMRVADGMMVQEQNTVAVNIGINYGNSTIQWHNGTVVPFGQFLLNATMMVATVEFMNYPGFLGPGLPGAFVTSINGVRQNPAANLYWTYWVYNPQARQYEMTQVGSGSYALSSDQTIQWYYQNAGSLTNPALQPYTSVSLNARLDYSTDPPTAVIDGSIRPVPGGPVNVTLEYSSNQGTTYQEISRTTSAADGTFSYSWRTPGAGMFLVRANAQGVKSPPVSIVTSRGIPGFPLESMLAGVMLGIFLRTVGRRLRPDSRRFMLS